MGGSENIMTQDADENILLNYTYGNLTNLTDDCGMTIEEQRISWDDATWILTCSFIIFTMQSGFGLLESGTVNPKNEVNIMVKNAVDVIFGGISFWIFGFGVAFDDETIPDGRKNAFSGVGPFLVNAEPLNMGYIFSCFIFQLSFATTATTIVSGAMAERTKLHSYMIFSFCNTAIYCFPAYWIWAPHGFLRKLGAVDIAGASAVHLVGGTTGLIATVMLKPRNGRFREGRSEVALGSPTNVMLGMFMLWWGWLGFNCGSTFGISGGKWKLAARSAVASVNSSIGGGFAGLMFSFLFKKKKFHIVDLVNGVLGALVSITAICAIAHPLESLVIGFIGGLLAVSITPLLEKLHIDDPVGVIPVHGVCSIWSMMTVGIFAEKDIIRCLTFGRKGIFRGGDLYLLGVQLLACLCIAGWTTVTSCIMLKLIDKVFGLRVSIEEEDLGADYVEHAINLYSQVESSIGAARLQERLSKATPQPCIQDTRQFYPNSTTQNVIMRRRSSLGARHISLPKSWIVGDNEQNSKNEELSNREYDNLAVEDDHGRITIHI